MGRCLVVLLLVSGCSFLVGKGGKPSRAGRRTCEPAIVPLLDSLVAVPTAAVFVLTLSESSGGNSVPLLMIGLPSFALAALYSASAIYGGKTRAQCNDEQRRDAPEIARREEAIRLSLYTRQLAAAKACARAFRVGWQARELDPEIFDSDTAKDPAYLACIDARRPCLAARAQAFTQIERDAPDREHRIQVLPTCPQHDEHDRTEHAWVVVKHAATAAVHQQCEVVERAAAELARIDSEIAKMFASNADVQRCANAAAAVPPDAAPGD